MSLLGIIALVFAVIAWRRTRTAGALGARIEKLEREMAALRAALGASGSLVTPTDSGGATAADLADRDAPATPVATAPTLPADAVGEEPRAVAPEAAAAAPPAPKVPEPRPVAPQPPRPSAWENIDWERLFGVRGAAVLGGIALALAGLLFFKYSIEHGLIPPWLRVVMGTVVGVACIGGGEWTLRKRYAATADALAGGGLVVLYAAFWAASVRYDLVPLAVGFALMIAVTATGCALAARHQALVTALIGLVGGFATPLLLSSGSDRPIGLFGYVLLLDVALLVLARRGRWPWLALLSLAGTLLYQVLWIGTRMGPQRLDLGLVILGVFAVLFAVAGQLAPKEDRRGWWLSAAAAVLAPFAFALYFAIDADFGPDLNAVAALLVLLSFAAGWLARAQNQPALGLGAAAASLAVLAVWVGIRVDGDGVSAWQLTLWCGALAAAFHVFVERDPQRADSRGPTPAAALAAIGGFVLTIGASPAAASLAPWLVGWSILAALLLRHAGLPGRAPLHLVAALAVGLALAVLRNAHDGEAWFPSLTLYLPLTIAAALIFQLVALRRREAEATRFAEHAAALLPMVLLLYLEGDPQAPAAPFLLGTVAYGLLAAFAGTRLGAGGWLLGAMAATALAHDSWSQALLLGDDPAALAGRALALQVLAVVAFTAWPFLVARRYPLDRFAWPAAALAGPAWFLSLRRLYELRFGDAAIGLLPVALGALAVLALRQARAVAREEPLRTEVLAWFGAVALGFVTLAVPLQLAREWITIAWALEGVAVLWLWRRLDHPGLKYFALALLVAVAVRLIANPSVLEYYPRPAWRIVNWLLYTYLVPAAALIGASRVLAALELPRARPWEQALYSAQRPWGAIATGLGGLAVVFVWINLAIADWFGSGDSLVVSFERLPARDLATSIAWAVYALVLLVLGVARRSIGLRWASLALLLITIAKVFLHDLGELRDLYRVASLLGLAISLILVSLAYQRFVFGNDGRQETP